jgi:hypothetical protein
MTNDTHTFLLPYMSNSYYSTRGTGTRKLVIFCDIMSNVIIILSWLKLSVSFSVTLRTCLCSKVTNIFKRYWVPGRIHYPRVLRYPLRSLHIWVTITWWHSIMCIMLLYSKLFAKLHAIQTNNSIPPANMVLCKWIKSSTRQIPLCIYPTVSQKNNVPSQSFICVRIYVYDLLFSNTRPQ